MDPFCLMVFCGEACFSPVIAERTRALTLRRDSRGEHETPDDAADAAKQFEDLSSDIMSRSSGFACVVGAVVPVRQAMGQES